MKTLQMVGVTPVLTTPAGFLVSVYQEDDQEVIDASGELRCNCAEATLSGDSRCQHTLAIQEYLSSIHGIDSEPMIDQGTADYYLSRIASLDETMASNEESAKSQMGMIELWLEQQTEALERRKSFYALALEAWLHTNGITSKTLVHGIIRLRQQQPEIEILDEEAVLSDDRFVRIIPEKLALDKASLRKHVVSTGEEVPGISVHLRDPKFSYKIHNTKKGE
jgi:hypothetical protein